MPTATVTIRELKNKKSGIDLSVPNYEETAGLLGSTVVYNVVVVTNLDVFKSPKHKQTDTVQFMIGKKFDDFNDLHKKLNEKFSGTALPPLPRKVLMKSDTVIKERRNGLEHFMKFIAVVPKIVTSPTFLEFLGVSSSKAGKFQQEDEKVEEDKDKDDQETKEEEEESADVFDEDEADNELFIEEEGEKDDKLDDLFNSPTSKTEGVGMFEEPDLGGGVEAGEAEDLFLPSAIVDKKPSTREETPEDRENSELLKIDDDLDELLSLKVKKTKDPEIETETKEDTPKFRPVPAPRKLKPEIPPKSKQISNKPNLPVKPKPLTTKPKPPLPSKPNVKEDNPLDAKSSESKTKSSETVELSNDDIMKYITDNSSTDADLDLF
ncbi:hypothetical protein SNE40_006323 [Patella caerulea]|uniref:PX domain-containing protein n=1 Tax=Patella caerulea TaxID=87958 RepID=A0AAN8K160_PATCE